MTDIKAHVRFLPQSAQKVRAVIDTVRGKSAIEALETLKFVNKRAALPVYKLVASAVANAEENFGVSRDDLFVAKIVERLCHVNFTVRLWGCSQFAQKIGGASFGAENLKADDLCEQSLSEQGFGGCV